jgi:2-oxoisovalerate dehydrogenase E1 component alpha subunit
VYCQITKNLHQQCLSTQVDQSANANRIEPATVLFPGIRKDTPIQTTPKFLMPEDFEPIPIYRVLDREGNFLDESQDPKLDREFVSKLFRSMVQMNTIDKLLYESQRQGRISFYMTNFGEEASQIGSAAALDQKDLVYAQYREAAVLLWRGFTISDFIDQCYGNEFDEGLSSIFLGV